MLRPRKLFPFILFFKTIKDGSVMLTIYLFEFRVYLHNSIPLLTTIWTMEIQGNLFFTGKKRKIGQRHSGEFAEKHSMNPLEKIKLFIQNPKN